jgi:quercetin dioxygenase-like cupin family protein
MQIIRGRADGADTMQPTETFTGSGEGRVALEDAEPAAIRAGDAVRIAPGERHWHGAGATAHMVHTAVSLGETRWEEPVTD